MQSNANEKLYDENDVEQFYAEQSELFSTADSYWAFFESWCADHNVDPTDPASFERYLESR